jgi:MFS transporter, DHA1 family, multidrug resistance protein
MPECDRVVSACAETEVTERSRQRSFDGTRFVHSSRWQSIRRPLFLLSTSYLLRNNDGVASSGSQLNTPHKGVKNRSVGVIIAALSALGPFSVDTYFPSFPALAAHFGVSRIQVQSTLSFYLVALAGMNLFHGALSDSFGRRRVILTSLGVYAASALACIVAPSFGWLLALRVIQGLAGGAGMIVGRAVIRDCYEGAEAQKFMAQVTMVSGLGPVIAPILGGWLHVWFGWRGPFCFLAFLGTILWCGSRWLLPETLPPGLRQSFHPGRLVRSYAEAICHPVFVLLCLALGLGGGGFLLYVATAPDVVLNILKLSETQFGWLFVPIVSGFILGSAMMARLAGRVSSARLVRGGFALMTVGAIANLVANLWFAPRVPWSVLPLTLYTFGFSLVAPVATIQSLELFLNRKGLASSLQGFSQILVFAVISSGGAAVVYRSGLKHAAGLAILMGLSCLAYYSSRLIDPPPPEGRAEFPSVTA